MTVGSDVGLTNLAHALLSCLGTGWVKIKKLVGGGAKKLTISSSRAAKCDKEYG